MAYEMVMPYHLHMPSYFLETFTEYPYKGDEVTMSEFRHRGDEEKLTTLNELKPFGLNQAINHLKVEKATGKKLILKSDYARLTFRKF